MVATFNPQSRASRVWALATRQHGVVALFQLLALGYTVEAVRWTVAKGRLHPVRPRVYAVGRPDLTRKGEWMAAVLTCGPDAVLSHESAAALWGIRHERKREIHVSTPPGADHRQPGLRPHRRSTLPPEDVTTRDNIPVTAPVLTLIDLATRLPAGSLEAAINEADKLDLVDPPTLRKALDARRGQRGTRPLRGILDRATFVLTDTELERCFVPIAARAGLPRPETQRHVNGFRVDFYWPELGLVVEPTAFAITAHRSSSRRTAFVTRRISQRASLQCDSPTGRFDTTVAISSAP